MPVSVVEGCGAALLATAKARKLLASRGRGRGAAAAACAGPREATAGDVLADLDGRALTSGRLSALLRSPVAAVEVVPGTERRWPQSHSAKLRLTMAGDRPRSTVLFLKKVVARHLPAKTLHALQRDLDANKVEARFYQHFAPDLAARGVRLPRTVLVDERVQTRQAAVSRTDEEKEGVLRSGGLLFLMESVEGYFQASPLSFEQACCSLRAAAQLHASAWEDRGLLEKAASRLHPIAGYWSLHQRGEAEMEQMRGNWAKYLKHFRQHAPDLLSRPEIVQLADRLHRLAPWVAQQMRAGPGDKFATLVHGDYKAMNVFLPHAGGSEDRALPIDFQWTGVGLGMSDVAMHLSHSVAADTLGDGGEERLVQFYIEALLRELKGTAAPEYAAGVAWRHYRLGVLDWARMVFSVFFRDASPETFARKADNPNVGLCYRDVEASLSFVERVDRYLREFERERGVL